MLGSKQVTPRTQGQTNNAFNAAESLKYSLPQKQNKTKTQHNNNKTNKTTRKRLGFPKEIPGSQHRKKQQWGPSTAAPHDPPEETELLQGKQPVFRLQAKLGTQAQS